jgi:hypothetical protein
MMEAQRAAVVAEARSWLGTRYHHAADVKGRQGGVDCAMLLVRVYCDLGLVERFDPRPYTRDWFLHRNEERYLGFLLARSREVRTPLEGDIVLFKVGRDHPCLLQRALRGRGCDRAFGGIERQAQDGEIRELLGIGDVFGRRL